MKKLLYNTQYIDAYLQKHNITKEQFCERAGITMEVLNKFYEQKNTFFGHSLKVAIVLNISTDTFWLLEKRRY